MTNLKLKLFSTLTLSVWNKIHTNLEREDHQCPVGGDSFFLGKVNHKKKMEAGQKIHRRKSVRQICRIIAAGQILRRLWHNW